MASVRDQGVLELLGRHVSLNEYEEIRELWKKHSIAEPTKRKFRGEKICIDSIEQLIRPRSTEGEPSATETHP